jgi:hypothetical protein
VLTALGHPDLELIVFEIGESLAGFPERQI